MVRKFQESAAGKFLAVVLLLSMTFTGTVYSIKACQSLPFLNAESYQDTAPFYTLLHSRLNDVAAAFAVNEQLKDPSLDYLARRQLQDELKQLRDGFDVTNTPLRGIVRDEHGEAIFSNTEIFQSLSQNEMVYYASFELGNHYVTMEGFSSSAQKEPEARVEKARIYTIECVIQPEEQLAGGVYTDDFALLYAAHQTAKSNITYWSIIVAVSLFTAGLWLLYILWTAGHKAGEEGIVLTWQEKIWFDVYLFVMLLAGTLLMAFIVYLTEELVMNQTGYLLNYEQSKEIWSLHIAGLAAACTGFVGMVTLTLRTFVVRLKARALARSTLTCRVLMWCWNGAVWTWDAFKTFVRSLPFLWRTIVVCLVYFFADVMLVQVGRYNGFAGFLWFVLDLAVLLLLCWWSMGFRRLRRGSQAIAAGNLSHQIDTRRMPEDLQQVAEDLNNISGGLQNAVNEQMKSERFKAELITNVSHDLKTPLTSIINYVDLLKTTEQTDPKAEEYIQVLDRKAQRLKKLTEDLVEASKASTGTLNVNREKIGMSQLVDQALGEYGEKLERRNLTVLTTLPEEEAYVYADGRHLWRVIDNLLSNCCKYAMEGTRVYIELARGKGQVILSVKNISREPLNVPAERLMERFVRGEESRSTEGSGLGLSIARSLTELQGGTFELAVDGDLFKAVVTMPQAG